MEEEKPLTIEGPLTFNDYHESHRLAARRQRTLVRSIVFLLGTALVFLGFSVPSSLQPGSMNWLMIIGAALTLNAVVVSPIRFRYLVRWRWDRYPGLHKGNQRFFISDAGIAIPDDLGNPALLQWDRFIKWEESNNLFLIYLSPGLWYIVSKHWLPPDEQVHLRSYLTRHLGPAFRGQAGL